MIALVQKLRGVRNRAASRVGEGEGFEAGGWGVTEAAFALADLHDAWRHCPALRPAHRRLLDALPAAYPSAMSRDEPAAAAGVSPNSSSFANDVSRLSSLGIVENPTAGQVRAGSCCFRRGVDVISLAA